MDVTPQDEDARTSSAETSASPTEAIRPSGWRRYVNRTIAAEISTITRHFARTIQWRPRKDDSGYLLTQIECREKSVAADLSELSAPVGDAAIVLNGNLNHHYDIQALLEELTPALGRSSRVIAVAYNPYLRAAYLLANWIGARAGELPTTFLTETDLRNLAALAGYQVVRIRPAVYLPWSMLGLGTLVNKLLPAIPLLRRLAFTSVITLRPLKPIVGRRPSISIIVPARNERGNIESLLARIPDLGTDVEIIFVEGHSTDGTWEEIQAVLARPTPRFELRALRQTGRGKSDAVRAGLDQARGELLTILDADLTVPPELLGRFYDAYCSGLADFVNGTRLVYPMERAAMRYLNRLGNVFFAKALGAVLEVPLGDVLCGTKLMSRQDYARMVAWRRGFGEFDPFGDFELLFPAAVLGLGITDVPVRYRARTYGSTNISRFRHGALLLRMVAIGLWRIRLGR